MKLRSSLLRTSFLACAVLLFLGTVRVAAQSEKRDGATNASTKTKKLTKLKSGQEDKTQIESAQEGPEFLRRRQDWFFKPRAFPIGFIPEGARERALQQKTLMYQQLGQASLFAAPRESVSAAPPSAGPTSAWFAIGPQPTSSLLNPPFTSGRVTALAVNPNNANNVYLGGADGGLWITTDGGNTWTSLTDNPPNAANIPTVAVGAIAVDPATCGAAPNGICTTVYVGTGEDNFAVENVYGEGVLNCTIAAGTPPTAACTQDSTFHATSPLDPTRGGPNIGALAVNPAAGQNSILLAGLRGRGSAIQSGVWCSANKGSTWTWVLPATLVNGAGDPATDVGFASDGTAWVALGSPFSDSRNGIYKSAAPVTSCSVTFTQETLPTTFTATNIGRITLALAPSDNTKVYAAIADATTGSSNLLGVVRSVNASNAAPTWTQLTDPLVSADSSTNASFCRGQCFYDMALAVDSVNPDVVFAGGSGQDPIIRTMNGTTTATWGNVTGTTGVVPHVDTHAFGFAKDGSKLWVGNDGGVWTTAGPTATTIAWMDLNGPAGTSTGALNLTQFYPGVSIHPANPGFAIGGSQDNGIQVDESWNPNNPAATALTWQDSGLPCDGGFTVIDPSVPSTSYGECEYIPGLLLVIATTHAGDGLVGNGFLVTDGIDGTDRGSFIPPLVVDNSNSQTLYFGTCRVWQTKNGGLSWNAISPDVTSPTHPTTCPEPTAAGQASAILSTIAVAPSDSKTIYVGSDRGEIEVTADGGTTWASIVTTALPTRAVTQIAVDPTTATTAYATFSGFGTCNNSAVICDGKGHVFKGATTAGVTTWLDISGTTTRLPDIPVNAMVIDPDDNAHNTLYVGTDIGAFFTTDGGVNWAPLGAADSMPNAQILSLTLHDPSRTLRAATHGRGLWDLNLGPGTNTPTLVISKISPFSATAPGTAATLNVDGTGFTSSSTIMWNGTAKTTTFVSATQLTAPILATDLSASAVVQVSVKDGTNTSNSMPFTVLAPAPTIASVSPTNAQVNAPATQITVTGTNFGSSSVVVMNPDVGGTALLTPTSVTATQLTATIPASFMASFGSTNSVGVQNPPPGGGTTVTALSVTLPTFVVIAPAPANDNFANAMNITLTSGSFTDTRDSSGATTQTTDPTPRCAGVASNTLWYKFTPTSNGTITDVDTIGSSYDTVLSIWTGTALSPVACNDDINPRIVVQSQIQNVAVTAGTTYYIMVSSFGAPDPNPLAFGGKSVLNFSFSGTTGGGGVATTTTVTSSSMSISSGGSVTLTATVVGTGTGASPTGTVQFMNGTTALGTPQTCTAVSGATSPTCTAMLTTTLAFLAPPGPNRIPTIRGVPWLLPAGFVLLVLLLLGLKRVPKPYRRAYACASLLLLAGLVAGLAAGCGGGYGGGGGGGTHYDSITAVYSGDATYAPSTSSAITITVQ